MLVMHHITTNATKGYQPTQATLPTPQQKMLEVSALGDPYFFASTGLVWLQYFDDQPGLTLSYHDLDYHAVAAWLEALSALAPDLQYPHFMATRLYASVTDNDKKRIMLNYVHRAYQENPERWRWLAESAVIARHQLKDLPLALRFAKDLADHSPANAPAWVRDMQIIILEAMNEYEAALLLTGALIQSGTVTDEHELNFLTQKLEALKTKIPTNAP